MFDQKKIHLIKKIYNNNKHGLKFWWNENIKMILTYRRTPLSRSKINRTHAWLVFKRQSSMKSPCGVLWVSWNLLLVCTHLKISEESKDEGQREQGLLFVVWRDDCFHIWPAGVD